jgi:hypothetical protein
MAALFYYFVAQQTVGLPGVSVDNLDDLARSRINQHGVIIHIGVSVTLDVILSRNVVVGHSVRRQHGTDAQIIIVIGRVMLPYHVLMKMAAIIYTEYPADGTGHGPDGSPDHLSNWPPFSSSLRGPLLSTAYCTLCMSC